MPPQNGGGQASSKRQLALSWRDEDIISVYKQTPALKPDGFAVTGFGFPPQQPVAHVKFGLPAILEPELKNHQYVFRALRDMPPDQTRGVRVPEIYRTLESDGKFFIVMEYIPGSTLGQLLDQEGGASRQEALTNSIARAMRLLMSIPVPAGQKPGPVGGGYIRHSLFKDDTSYCIYPSVDELEKHLNVVRNSTGAPSTNATSLLTVADTNTAQVARLRDKEAPTVSLERNLCFYYSDFYENNFMFTDSGDLYVIDLDQAGFLPPSFMSYALAESHWAPGRWVGDVLKLPEHNLEVMKKIHYFFMICSSNIGELGEPCPLCHPKPQMANIKLAAKGLPRPPKKRRALA